MGMRKRRKGSYVTFPNTTGESTLLRRGSESAVKVGRKGMEMGRRQSREGCFELEGGILRERARNGNRANVMFSLPSSFSP